MTEGDTGGCGPEWAHVAPTRTAGLAQTVTGTLSMGGLIRVPPPGLLPLQQNGRRRLLRSEETSMVPCYWCGEFEVPIITGRKLV